MTVTVVILKENYLFFHFHTDRQTVTVYGPERDILVFISYGKSLL